MRKGNISVNKCFDIPGMLVIMPMSDKGRFLGDVGDGHLIDCNKILIKHKNLNLSVPRI